MINERLSTVARASPFAIKVGRG